MKNTKRINELRVTWETLRELQKVSQKLHRYHEKYCNCGLTPRQEKRYDKLVEQAKELAEKLELKAYIQGDPRGGALYLVPKEWTDEEARMYYFPHGMAIY